MMMMIIIIIIIIIIPAFDFNFFELLNLGIFTKKIQNNNNNNNNNRLTVQCGINFLIKNMAGFTSYAFVI